MKIQERNEMSDKYKQRVAKFIKEMSEKPVINSDYWEPSQIKFNDLIKNKGGMKDHM